MITVDMTSDVAKAIREIEGVQRQLPFVISSALNSTAFIVRHHIVQVTYPASFKVRNAAFPKRVFRVTKLSTKRDLEAAVGDALGYPYFENHARGGFKLPRAGGKSLAIPLKPDDMRTSRGGISKPLKPVNITNRKDVFLVTKGGQKSAIIRRKKGSRDVEVIYVFRNQAIIKPRFPFYEQTAHQFAFHIQREFAVHLRRLTTRALFA